MLGKGQLFGKNSTIEARRRSFMVAKINGGCSKIQRSELQLVVFDALGKVINIIIIRLKAANGSQFEDIKGIEDTFCQLFWVLLIFSSMNLTNMDKVVQHTACNIVEALKDFLQQPSSIDEVIQALKQISLDKSPCPDGMNPFFYQ